MNVLQYKHHEDAVRELVRRFENEDGVVAVVLGGSVAKGTARPDSDIDAAVVVTDAKHRELEARGRVAECVSGCGYEGGYFDIKYCTAGYLRAAAEGGSEPSRNAFAGARCLFSRDAEIPALVARIPVYPRHEKDEKMLSFYSAFALNEGYLWSVSDNPYMRVRTAADIVLFGLRLLLAEREVLFPCQRRLCATVRGLGPECRGAADKADAFLARMDDASKEEFKTALSAVLRYRVPEDFSTVLSRFVADWELWWHEKRPLVAEW